MGSRHGCDPAATAPESTHSFSRGSAWLIPSRQYIWARLLPPVTAAVLDRAFFGGTSKPLIQYTAALYLFQN